MHDIPAVGTKVSLNDGEELLTIKSVAEFITLSDGSWIDFRTWRSGVRDGIIKIVS